MDCSSFLETGALFSLDSKTLLIGYGSYSSTAQSKLQGYSFYSTDFFLKGSKPWFNFEKTIEISFEQLKKELSYGKTDKVDWNWKNQSKKEFENAFNNLQVKFTGNTLKKAVPYVFETSDQMMSQDLLAANIGNLLDYAQNQPLFIYGLWDKNQGVLGATPEKLFTIKDKELSTIACAGTASTSEYAKNLLKNQKELREHKLVVQGISEALSPFGLISVGEQTLLKLPNLCHLITPIKAYLDKLLPFNDLVSILHPTPALGGFPKEAVRHWLIDYQTLIPRGRFGAPIGYFHPEKEGQCLVAIRNLQWDENGSRIGAGCGVIQESNFEQEWEEILTKIRAIKNMFGLSK